MNLESQLRGKELDEYLQMTDLSTFVRAKII